MRHLLILINHQQISFLPLNTCRTPTITITNKEMIVSAETIGGNTVPAYCIARIFHPTHRRIYYFSRKSPASLFFHIHK